MLLALAAVAACGGGGNGNLLSPEGGLGADSGYSSNGGSEGGLDPDGGQEETALAPFDLLKDISTSEPGEGSEPQVFTAVGGRVFFKASVVQGGSKPQLWVTDGTRSGTVLVPGVGPIAYKSGDMFELGGKLIFVAWGDTASAEQLWVSDGTKAGTMPLTAELKDGFSAALYRNQPFIRAGEKLYFLGNDGTHGTEVWVTDGTMAGTRMVIDTVPGTGSMGTELGVAWNGRYCFYSTDAKKTTLWATDGTDAGTQALTSGPSYSQHPADSYGMALVNDRLLFTFYTTANSTELWASDGTPTGTALLKNIAPDNVPGAGAAVHSYPRHFSVLGNKLLFFAHKDYTALRSLWVSDGTPGGTIEISQVNVETSDDNEMVPVGGKLVFNGKLNLESGIGKDVLWGTDGTAAGTEPIAAVSAHTTGSDGRVFFAPLGSSIVFMGGPQGETDFEPWITDGTKIGTRMIKDILAGPGGSVGIGQASAMATLNGKVYLAAAVSIGDMQLFETDGTSEGTRTVAPDTASAAVNPVGRIITAGSATNLGHLFVYGDTLLLPASYHGLGAELYRYKP